MGNWARQQAFRAVSERCPVVENILDDAVSDITRHLKDQVTEPLRDALIEAYEIIEARDSTISDLEEERDTQEKRADDAEDELGDLRRELAQVRDELESLR